MSISRWTFVSVVYTLIFLLNGCNIVGGIQFWKEVPVNALEASKYADLPPFVFAPGGRLYSVEKISQEVQSEQSNLVVAIVHREGVVIASSMHKSPYLHSEARNETVKFWEPLVKGDTNPPNCFCQLGKTESSPLWACFAGNGIHVQLARQEVYDLCDGLRGGQGRLSAPVLARSWADGRQRPTQVIREEKMLAYVGVLATADSCWRVDPSGQFFKCNVVVAGKAAAEAENIILDRIRTELGMEDENYLTSNEAQHTTLSWTHEQAKDFAVECVSQALKPRRTASAAGLAASPADVRVLSIRKSGVDWFEQTI